VWRLGRQTNYVFVSAQWKQRPARTQGIELLIGENNIIPGVCVPRASVEFSITCSDS